MIRIRLSDALSTRSYENVETLLQQEAYRKASRILKEIRKKLRMADQIDHASNDDDDLHPSSRKHHIIFVEGHRGAGKTTFLLNLSTFLRIEESELAHDFKMLSPIDPTIADESDHFISTLLAHVMRTVSRQLRKRQNTYGSHDNSSERLESDYNSACRDVLESMEALLDQKRGDELSRSVAMVALKQAGMELERNLDRLFKVIARIFDCKAIILPIDDIDMEPARGYEILEVLRKYLVSPHVVPVVSGTYDYYCEIVEQYYLKSISPYGIGAGPDNNSGGVVCRARKFSNAYLHKLFPIPHRIHLKPIENILAQEEIKLVADGPEGEVEIFFHDLSRMIREIVLNGISRYRASEIRLIFESVRDFTYLLDECRNAIGHIADFRNQSANSDGYLELYRSFLVNTYFEYWGDSNSCKVHDECTEEERANEGHKDIRKFIAWDREVVRRSENDDLGRQALDLALQRRNITVGASLQPPDYVIDAINLNDDDVQKARHALIKLIFCVQSVDPLDSHAYLSPIRALLYAWSLLNGDKIKEALTRLIQPEMNPRSSTNLVDRFYVGGFQSWNLSKEFETLQKSDSFNKALDKEIESLAERMRQHCGQASVLFIPSAKIELILDTWFSWSSPHPISSTWSAYINALDDIIKRVFMYVEGETGKDCITLPDSDRKDKLIYHLFPSNTRKQPLKDTLGKMADLGFKVYRSSDVDIYLKTMASMSVQFLGRGDSTNKVIFDDLEREFNELVDEMNLKQIFSYTDNKKAIIKRIKGENSEIRETLKYLVQGDTPSEALAHFCSLLDIHFEALELRK
ncbi:MAG: hypothetical protein HQL67_11070 [Magnetococcales bacterium]|nr:hypothetical protein [Magnetococcales bacterium]